MTSPGAAGSTRRLTGAMQRLHERDLAALCLDLEFTHVCLPATAEHRTTVTFPRSGRQVIRKPGAVLWPAREDHPELEAQRRLLGSAAYAGQYQQQPVPPGGLIFQRTWWQFYDALPDRLDRYAQSWDMAFKGEPDNDYVVGLTAARRGADIYLIDRVKGHWDTGPRRPGDHGELARVRSACSHRLISIIEAQAARLRQSELSGALQEQRTHLAGFPQSEVVSVLQQAQDEWNVETYEESCSELARLDGLRHVYEKRLALLVKLKTTAPAWAQAIAQRAEPHHDTEPPANPTAAWRWRQWHQELERRAAISMDELQDRLYKMELEVPQLSARIIEHETWAAQCDRTGLEQQQALMGFVQTMKKVGKGTGKRVPELLRKARRLLTRARHAVPVWIMPLSRVYESFNPRETKFDVVIIDEASQSDVTALAALYLGRTHIVVGDKEQVTPDAIGQRIEDVQRLIATDLQSIPNSHLYDGVARALSVRARDYSIQQPLVLQQHHSSAQGAILCDVLPGAFRQRNSLVQTVERLRRLTRCDTRAGRTLRQHRRTLTPQDRRLRFDRNALPDCITLFQRPIEADHEAEDEIRAAIGETLIHEVGHYFGLSEEEIEEIEERYWRGDTLGADEDDK